MKFAQPVTIALWLVGLATHGYSQYNSAAAIEAARKEQAAQLAAAAAAAEQMDQAADAIIAGLRAAVDADAPVKAYDEFLQKISSLTLANGQRYSANPKLTAARTFATQWQDYLFAISQDNREQALRTLQQLVQQSSAIPIIPRSELMAMQEKQMEQLLAADKALIDLLLEHFKETLEQADSAAGVQPFLQEVIAAQANYNQTHQDHKTTALQVIGQLTNFTNRWQQALSEAESGKANSTQVLESNLFNENSYNYILPVSRPYRGKIIDTVNNIKNQSAVGTIPSPSSIPEGPRAKDLTVDNLDDLVTYILKNRRGEHALILARVQLLVQGRNALRAHQRATSLINSTKLNFNGVQNIYAEQLNSIWQTLLNQCFKADLNSMLEPLPDEHSTLYLRRIIQTALDAGDWHAAHNALVLQRDNTNISSPDEISAIPGLLALIKGDKQEATGQYEEAENSYKFALNCPSTLIPVKELETRLKNIKVKLPKPTPSPSDQAVASASLFDDARVNGFLLVGLLAGILGTLGVQRLR